MKSKYVILATAAILVTTISLLFYLHTTSEKEVILRFQAEQLLDSRQLAREIKLYLLDKAQEVNSLLSLPSFQNHDITKMDKDVQAFMDLSGNNSVTAINVYNENGEIIFTTEKDSTVKKIIESDLFQGHSIKESNGKQFFSFLAKSNNNSKIPASGHRFILVTPFYKTSSSAINPFEFGKLSGVVTSTIDLSAVVSGMLAKVSADTTNENTYLIDKDGMILTHNKHHEMVLLNINSPDKRCLNCHISFDHYKRILNGNEGTFEYSLIGSPKELGSFSTIETMNVSWKIIISIPFNEVSGFINKDLLLTLLVIGIITLSLVISSWLIYRSNRLQIRAEEEARQLIEKRELEQEILESETQYRMVVDNSPDAVIIHCDGIIVFVNPAAIEFVGASSEKDLLGKPAIEFVHPDERELVTVRILEVIKSGKTSLQMEERFLKLDGGSVYGEVVSSPIVYNGKPSLQVIIHDVTERKRTELERQVLYEITHGVTTSGSLDELLKLIHRTLGKVLYAENCFVALKDHETGLFSFPYFVDKYDPIPAPANLGKSCTSYVFRSNKPLLLTPKLFEQLKELGEAELVGSASPSWVGIPLQTPDRVIGVLVLQHYEKENVYNSRDLQFLDSIGSQVAIIIERKQAEEALRESEIKFRSYVENAPDGIFITNPAGFYLDVNSSSCKLLGYSKDELLNMHVSQIVPQEELERAKESLNIIQTKGSYSHEFLFLRKDGTLFNGWLDALKISDTKYLGFVKDITERKRAETALRESEVKLNVILESTADGILAIDENGKVIKTNQRFVDLWHIPDTLMNANDDDALLNYAMDQLINPEEFISKIQKLYGSKVEDLDVLYFKDGRTFERFSAPLIMSESSIGRVWSFRDITDRILVEREIKKRNEELSKINSEKNKFFSIIAHDLRSPFQGFINMTELMVRDIKTFTLDELSLISKEMNDTAGNLFKLLVNLLEWAQIQKGELKYVPHNCSLLEIVNEGIKVINQIAAKKEILVVNNIHDYIRINVDEKMINSVIRNLLSNAVKFSMHGGKIIVDAKVIENEIVKISVSDTGIGMSEDLCKKLFKMEEIVGRKGTEGEKSTGLGLLLCKEFVEKHSGKIWAESEENIGSTFYFTLPMVP